MPAQRDLFISYSRKNRRFVDKLARDLREHHIDIWLDSIDIGVGDPIHLTIEDGIRQSRYFCLVLSPESLASYYVRSVEFEEAFTRMVSERRTVFILPILIKKLDQELPPRLANTAYLDFRNAKDYDENVRKLVRKIRLEADDFTGERWYKALEISPFGEIVGVSEITQAAPTGPSVKLIWQSGLVAKAEIYYNGSMEHYKLFTFDDRNRVFQNMMYKSNGLAPAQYVDTWRYIYDPETSRRVRKIIDKPGATSQRELIYDGHNNVLEEVVRAIHGPFDASYGYARKLFEYSADGQHVVRETLFDNQGNVTAVNERTSAAN